MTERSLFHSFTPESFTRIIQRKLPRTTALQHAAIVISRCCQQDLYLFSLSRHCCVITTVSPHHPSKKSSTDPGHSPGCLNLLGELCYSLTHDKFRASLFINRMKKGTQNSSLIHRYIDNTVTLRMLN